MERNASGLTASSLVLGMALDAHLENGLLSTYSLQIYPAKDAFFLGKPIQMPVTLTELEMTENHLQSVLTKLAIPFSQLELRLLPHG